MSILNLINPNQSVSSGFFPEPRANVPSLGELNYLRYNFDTKAGTVNSLAKQELIQKYRQQQQDLLKQRTGKTFNDLTSNEGKYATELGDKEVDSFILEGRKQNPEIFSTIPTSEEVIQSAIKEAQQSQIDYQQARTLREGVLPFGVDLAAGTAAYFSDPINVGATIALAPLAASGSVLRAALIEGGANMAAEAITIPSALEWQKDLGNKYGMPEITAQLATAFGLGAGVGVLGRVTLDSLRPSNVFEFLSKQERLGPLQRLAAKYQEKYAAIDEYTPDLTPASSVRDSHLESFNKIYSDFSENRPIDFTKPKFDYDRFVEKLRSSPSESVMASLYNGFSAKIDKSALYSKELASVENAVNFIKSPEFVQTGDTFRTKTLSEYLSDNGGIKPVQWFQNFGRISSYIDSNSDIFKKGLESNNSIRLMADKAQDAGFLVTKGYKPYATKRISEKDFLKTLHADMIGETRLFSSKSNQLTKATPEIRKAIKELEKAGIDWKSKDTHTIMDEYRDFLNGVVRDEKIETYKYNQAIERGFVRSNKTIDDFIQENRVQETPEFKQAYDADIKRFVNENADEVIEIDGDTKTVAQIMEDIAQDQRLIEAMNTCRI